MKKAAVQKTGTSGTTRRPHPPNDSQSADPDHQQLAARLLQMVTGHWVSQTVATLARLDIPDAIAKGAETSAEVAARAGIDPDATYRLMRAASGLGLLTEGPGQTFGLTPLGELLRSDVQGSMRDYGIAETDEAHWLAWGHLTDAVRTGERIAPKILGREIFQWYEAHPEDAAAFAASMGNLAELVADEVANVCDFSDVKTIVDVGGSHGALLAKILRKYPRVHGVILDLPGVVERAKQSLEAQGLADRADAVAGDFFADVPPADVYLLKQILHDWNDEQARTILSHCARRMSARGSVYIVEMIIPDDNAPSMAAMVDLNMLVMLPGRERSLKEYRALLEASGLRFERVLATHSPFQVIQASRC